MFIKLIIITVLIIFNNPKISGESDTKWIDSLTKSVQKNKIHQTIFFINEVKVTKNQIVENLVRKFSKNIPVIEIVTPNYEIPTEFDFTRYNPRVSLFILSNSEKDPPLVRTIDFLTKLSEAKRRPKCLLLLFYKIENYRKFFEQLWHRQFLDVTLIEIGKRIIGTDLIVHTKDHYPDQKMINYNPFLKLITNKTLRTNNVWFPDKLKNMHGYQLEAILLFAPPDVIIPQDPSSEISGLAIMKIEAWEKVINFKMVRSPLREWGKFGCTIKDSTGVCLYVYANKAQILGVEAPVALCDGKPSELSKSIQASKIGMLVPLVKKDIEIDQLKWQIKSILTVVILPIFFWIVSVLLDFSRKKWKLHYMFQITLGNVIPQEPQTFGERIIFIAFIIGCFMFSSEIYTAINRVQLKGNSPYKFETLEDVVDSNVQIIINRNYVSILNTSDDVIMQKILKNAVVVTTHQEECVERLLKYKNVTCILPVLRAELQLRNRRDECGQPLSKFILDKFLYDSGATQLGAGVPYAKRFDQVLQRIIDSGIRNKWLEPYSGTNAPLSKIGKSCTNNEMEPVMTKRQIIIVLVTGSFCSFVIFILELITHRVS